MAEESVLESVLESSLTGNKLVSRTINDESIYYYYNGHGDVLQLYDLDTNTVKAEFDYDAFGVVIKVLYDTLLSV